jgi:histidinol-phosphate/aromatic aminotransferase/cobyric acid decarboxylase-like protein
MNATQASLRVGLDGVLAGSVRHLRLTHATAEDREIIYRLRHEIYAMELGQHSGNPDGRLTDRLDDFNHYLVAWQDEGLAGFVSITPPGRGYSVDKYFSRDRMPFPLDDSTFEVRLLTVRVERRRREIAPLLMYASLRYVESRGGQRVVAIGRQEVTGFYRACGLASTGQWAQSGRVNYELLHATVEQLRTVLGSFQPVLDRLEQRVDWQLDLPFRRPAECFHGGSFFKAVGERFDRLDRAAGIINADVLDAWFPPAPGVLTTLRDHLPWLLRSSPPVDGAGLRETISEVRGVPGTSVLIGAGSSDLIFLALRHWLNRDSRVLILDPTYGEYAHLLEKVIGCRVDRFVLKREEAYDVSTDALRTRLALGYDLVVLVNPNSPTGRHLPRPEMEDMIRQAPARTRFWIDETYVDYAGPDQSLERFAAASTNVCVCKSMSKVYALSGVRAAYLVAPAHWVESLRAISPPWAVSLPGQVAAVRALEDPSYYEARWRETHALRKSLSDDLRSLGLHVISSVTSFLLVHLPADGVDTPTLLRRCETAGLFMRSVSNMGHGLGDRAFRVAVKDAATNRRMIDIIRRAILPS